MFTPEQQQEIEQELALVARMEPHFAQRVMDAIDAGKLDYANYIRGECGCFYGHATGLLDQDRAQQMAMDMRERLGGEGFHYHQTPIERLLEDEQIDEGDTCEESEGLANLYELLKPYAQV